MFDTCIFEYFTCCLSVITVPNNLVNVALRKRTYESSSFSDTVHFRRAFAVDGNRKSLRSQKSCTHTNKERNPWWMVDLGGSYHISYLKVTNRGDCCGKLGYFLTIQNVLKQKHAYICMTVYTYVHTHIYTPYIQTCMHTNLLATNTLL